MREYIAHAREKNYTTTQATEKKMETYFIRFDFHLLTLRFVLYSNERFSCGCLKVTCILEYAFMNTTTILKLIKNNNNTNMRIAEYCCIISHTNVLVLRTM